MSAFAQHWQARRSAAKSRRELQKAIMTSPAETVRLELVAIASRTQQIL